MNGHDFFFSSSPPTGEDDDWGEFVDSSPNPNRFSKSDRNGSDSTPNRIESDNNKNHHHHHHQSQRVTPRGPVPLSVFGEEEEEDESGAPFNFSFDSFSRKQNDRNGSNRTVEINGLIANLYRENEINGNSKDSSSPSKKIQNSGVSLENFSWNPLNLDTERSEKTSNVVNSNITSDSNYSDLSFVNRNDDDDDVDESWEFKTAESISPSADRSSKEEKENAESGSVMVQNTRDLNSSMWSSLTNGTGPSFDTGKRENGDDDDLWGNGGWEFKVAETRETKKDITKKEEKENAESGSSVVQITTDLNSSIWSSQTNGKADEISGDDDPWGNGGWGFKVAETRESKKDVMKKNTTDLNSSSWSSPTNGTGPSFNTGKIDAINSVFERESGDDDDSWGNGGWEFKDAETREPKKDIANKESNGWGFGFGFDHGSEIEKTVSSQPNFEKDSQKKENGSISFPSNADVNSGGTSWAFNQPSLETVNEKEEKEVQTDKPKGVLPLSFFEDETLETSDTLDHEDNLVPVCDFSVREKTKASNPTVSINDLISSLYSQVEEKNAANLSEKSATVNGEDDSWEFQSPTKTITDSSRAEGADDFESSWEFQGPSLAVKSSDVTDEFDDDSWEFQGPTQPVKDYTSRKGDNDSWESKQSSVENEVGNGFSVPNGFGESHEKTVISIDPNDYQDVFQKLKTELCYLALNHLDTLKEARALAADSDEVAEAQKRADEIQDLQNSLNNDGLIGQVNVESLQPRSSDITELYKALQEPKFRAVVSEDLLSEKLLSAEKDWKITIELLRHATLTLKILDMGSHEQQSKYASTWFIIASTCAQELRHAASIWKQVVENDVQEEILSKPQGKSYVLSVGEIYRVAKILKASTRLYKPWILLTPTSSNVLAVLDECVKLWLSSGLDEALRNNINRHQGLDHADHQLLESIKCIDEVDAFTLHASITSATSPTCYISGLSTEIVPGIETVEWNEEHYLVPLANIWANLISRDPPDLPGNRFLTMS